MSRKIRRLFVSTIIQYSITYKPIHIEFLLNQEYVLDINKILVSSYTNKIIYSF